MRNDACSLLLLETKTMMLRKMQNQNDTHDANDAESGIWYRGILKTASQASSASLSSHKSSAGVWGYTPEMCMWMTTCYASKTYSLPRREQSNWTPIQIRIYFRMNHFWFIQKSWLEKVNPFWFTFQSAAIIPLPPRAWSSRRCSFFRERGNAPS